MSTSSTTVSGTQARSRLFPWAGRLEQAPWWAGIIILLGITLAFFILTNEKYRETFQILTVGRPTSAATEGLLLTIIITLTSFAISLLLGLVAGWGRVSSNVVLYTISTLYVEVVRGVPLVVLILYVAFVLLPLGITLLNLIGGWLNITTLTDLTIRQIPMEWRAIVALAFGYGAYEAEIFRAGIQSIERGQMEAARSLGMNYFQSMRYIILPQAIRRVLPPLANDFISILKDSALATVLAVPEMTQLSRIQRSSTFRVFEVFNTLAFLYLSMTLLLGIPVKWLERRMSIDRRTDSTIR